MAFMIVPRVVTTSSAELWIGADNESADLDDSPVLLRTELGDRSIAGDWSVLGALGGRHFLRYKSVTLEGLRPGQRYTPTLLLGGAATAVATATVFTLPERLPTVLDPFIVLLGSWWWGSYYERTAAEGGRDARHVPRGCFVVDQSAAAVRDAASRGASGRARRSRRP